MPHKSIDEFVEEVAQVLPKVIRWFHINRANALTKAQLNPAQFFVLDIICELGAQTMSHLARQLLVSTPAVTRMVDKLYADKMVERIYGKKDRRVIRIDITAKGKRIVLNFRSQRKQALTDIFSQLCEKDRQDYLRVMLKMQEITTQQKG